MYLSLTITVALFGAGGVLANPVMPMITSAPRAEHALAKRASCTFSGSLGYSSASVSKKSCSTIVLSDLQVPGGVTLNLEKLTDGTTVSLFYMALVVNQGPDHGFQHR
jgi:polygalacturonase